MPTQWVIVVKPGRQAKIAVPNAQKSFVKRLSFAITSTSRPVGDVDTFDYLNTAEFFSWNRRGPAALQKLKIADIPSKEGPAGKSIRGSSATWTFCRRLTKER